MPRRVTAALAALAAAAALVWMWAAVGRAIHSGFVLRLVPHADGGAERIVRTFDLDPIRARRLTPSVPASARWAGWWTLRRQETLELAVAAHTPTRVLVDGAVALDHDGRPRRLTAPLALAAGTHEIVVEHELRSKESDLRVAITRAADEPRRLEMLPIFQTERRPPLERVRPWAGLVAVGAALALLAAFVPALREAPPDTRARLARRSAHAAAIAISLYGALLRLEALALKHDAPAWMSHAVPIAQAFHPRGMKWLPPEHAYHGDPFSYLRLARDMRWFYEASVREPVFVFVTRQMLWMTSDRDVAVSLASGVFSVLLVPAVYLLGLVAFSPGAGLLAAAAMAVERQVIGLGVDGWRDDAFALFAVLSAAALLRLRDRPTWTSSVLAGLAMGLALLTRITALSFVIPALALVALAGAGAREVRLRHVAAAAGLALLLLAPFLVTCAVEYGDPLHSINAHTRFYRSRAAGTHEAATGWHSMLAERGGPFTLLDTGLVGLTTYPFTSKWEHFDYLGGWIGPVLGTAAVLGLLLWTTSPAGRMLLVILFSSLLPFAFTWEVPGGSEWRFTLHAYPFYLLAAASMPALVASLARRRRPAARWVGVGAAVAVAGVAIAYFVLCGLAWARVREQIARGRETRVVVGTRDFFFFGEGWSRPTRAGNVLMRLGDETGATVRLPLRSGQAYRLAMRLDPEGLGARAAVTLNDAPVGELDLLRDDRRMARYEIELPAARTRNGANILRIRGTGRFRLWLIQVDPR